jgi:hypothetical protein
MSIHYSLSIATGIVVKKEHLRYLSFMPIAAHEDPDIFFDEDATLSECFDTVQSLLGQVLGDDIAVDLSFDQWSGSFEESIVFYAPSTYRHLDMREGNSFAAFSVNSGPVCSTTERAVLSSVADVVGVGSDNIGNIIWGSII